MGQVLSVQEIARRWGRDVGALGIAPTGVAGIHRGGGLRGVGALGIAPTGIARIHRRGGGAVGCAVWALWGPPLQGLRAAIDAGGARRAARCGRSGDRPYRGCAYPSTRRAARWLRGGLRGEGALGIAPTGVARGHRRGGCGWPSTRGLRGGLRGAAGVICGRGRRSGSGCWFWCRCASR
jgi:hypothetical protein